MTSMFNVCLFKSHYKIPLSRYSLNMDCLIDLLWINSTMKLRLSGVLAPIVCCHRRTIESGLGSCVTEWLQMHTAAAHSECSYEDDRRLTPSLLDICNVHLTPKSTRHHCWPPQVGSLGHDQSPLPCSWYYPSSGWFSPLSTPLLFKNRTNNV